MRARCRLLEEDSPAPGERRAVLVTEFGPDEGPSRVTMSAACRIGGPAGGRGGWFRETGIMEVDVCSERAGEGSWAYVLRFGLPWDERMDLVPDASPHDPVRPFRRMRGTVEAFVQQLTGPRPGRAAEGLPEGWGSHYPRFEELAVALNREARLSAQVRDLLRTAGAERIAQVLMEESARAVMES